MKRPPTKSELIKVLIADDDPIVRQALRAILEVAGGFEVEYSTIGCADGLAVQVEYGFSAGLIVSERDVLPFAGADDSRTG